MTLVKFSVPSIYIVFLGLGANCGPKCVMSKSRGHNNSKKPEVEIKKKSKHDEKLERDLMLIEQDISKRKDRNISSENERLEAEGKEWDKLAMEAKQRKEKMEAKQVKLANF